MSAIRTLLVEDDEGIVLAAVEYLSRTGVEVTVARSGREALQLLGEAAEGGPGFDALVLDWNVPDVGGRDLFVAARRACPEAGVVVLTGEALPALAASHDLLGGVELLRKPCTLSRLRRAIAASLPAVHLPMVTRR